MRESGGKPYAIPAGASDHKLGGLGFVGFAEEVRAQEAELGFKFDYIFVCSVTGSTQAGMIVGFAADGRADRVIGIDASAKPKETREQVKRIAQNTAELVELGRRITDDDVVLDERYAYPEYGVPSAETLDAIRAVRADGRHAHRPGLRGQEHAGHDRHDRQEGDSRRLEGALRPPRRRAGDQRLFVPVPERVSAAPPVRHAKAWPWHPRVYEADSWIANPAMTEMA